MDIGDRGNGGYELVCWELNIFCNTLSRYNPELGRFVIGCADKYVLVSDHMPNVLLCTVFSDSGDRVGLKLVKLVISFTCVIPDILAV